MLIALNSQADIIYFKDGMRTVCQERAWEQDEEVKCEYEGTILSYQKKDVIRIEKTRIEKKADNQTDKIQTPNEATVKPSVAPKVPQPATPEKKPLPQYNVSEAAPKKTEMAETKGLEFYNPRRPQKYWTSATSKHRSFEEAIATLAKQYDRPPEWIQDHMGDTNDLYQIHQNLKESKSNAPVVLKKDSPQKVPEILFYNPRRPQKYWTSANAKHKTFKEAISALAKEYGRTPEWVEQYMGTTNNLGEIHRNLAHRKEVEASP